MHLYLTCTDVKYCQFLWCFTIVDSQEDERIYDLRGIEKQSEKGLVIKNGIKVIKN